MSRQDEWRRETEAAALERLRSAANAHRTTPVVLVYTRQSVSDFDADGALPADQLHPVQARLRRSSVWRPSLTAPGDSSSTGSTTGRRSASGVRSSTSRSVSLRTRLRQDRSTLTGAKPSCSISRPHGRRLTRASGSASSRASSSISKPRLCRRVRCEWSLFRARLGDRFLRAWYWSGRRDSNPLPQPWEGRALPGELLPLGGKPILGSTKPSAWRKKHLIRREFGAVGTKRAQKTAPASARPPPPPVAPPLPPPTARAASTPRPAAGRGLGRSWTRSRNTPAGPHRARPEPTRHRRTPSRRR
jgi:hypothetical protein